MQADTTTLAPCPFCGGEAEEMMGLVGCEPCALARRDIASWNRRAPAPASGETETCKCCGEGSARIVVRRECDTCTSAYAGVAEHRLQKFLAEPRHKRHGSIQTCQPKNCACTWAS